MHKMSVAAPPKILVERFVIHAAPDIYANLCRYMIEIAKSHNVPFAPDPNVMREDEIAAAESMLIDFHNQGGNQGAQQGAQGGNFAWMYPNPNAAGDNDKKPPPPDNNEGYGGSSNGGGDYSQAWL